MSLALFKVRLTRKKPPDKTHTARENSKETVLKPALLRKNRVTGKKPCVPTSFQPLFVHNHSNASLNHGFVSRPKSRNSLFAPGSAACSRKSSQVSFDDNEVPRAIHASVNSGYLTRVRKAHLRDVDKRQSRRRSSALDDYMPEDGFKAEKDAWIFRSFNGKIKPKNGPRMKVAKYRSFQELEAAEDRYLADSDSIRSLIISSRDAPRPISRRPQVSVYVQQDDRESSPDSECISPELHLQAVLQRASTDLGTEQLRGWTDRGVP